MSLRLLLLFLLIGSNLFVNDRGIASAFLATTFKPRKLTLRSIRLEGKIHLIKEDEEGVDAYFGETLDLPPEKDWVSDQLLQSALKSREDQLQKGIGKRYITRTQKGFLNVHETGAHAFLISSSQPGDPYNNENIVNQLTEGEVVTSTASQNGDWICHDKGGWSISKYGGFTWLEPIVE